MEGVSARESGERGKGQSSGRKDSFAYFEGQRTLAIAPICRCFGFFKQCFVSNFGA